MSVHFGRVVYPLSSYDNAGAARKLAEHLNYNKGVQVDVVELNGQHFVVTGKDARAVKKIAAQYEEAAAGILNRIESDALFRSEQPVSPTIIAGGPMRMLGGKVRDWGLLGTGAAANATTGAVAYAQQLEQAAVRARESLAKLLQDKVEFWFPNSENKVAGGEFYQGHRTGDLKAAIFAEPSTEPGFQATGNRASGIVAEITGQRRVRSTLLPH